MEAEKTWFLQKPFQRYGGGAPFWDDYIHDGCMVISTTKENPLADKPNPEADDERR